MMSFRQMHIASAMTRESHPQVPIFGERVSGTDFEFVFSPERTAKHGCNRGQVLLENLRNGDTARHPNFSFAA